MSKKHLYNTSEGLVLKALEGAVALNPTLHLHAPSKSVFIHPKHRSSSSTVAVISGGGAGHEPAHASYTGRGMLTASVSGDIFASPSAKQVLNTLNLAATSTPPRDVLVIINNYTGDRLNFGLAIEKARGAGTRVESVVVADDVSLLGQSEEAGVVGARGLGGNILVCKILGALAERGAALDVMKRVGDAVVGNLRSIGVGLGHCHVPGRGSVKEELNEYECELGLGLHNEPGVRRMKVPRKPEELIGEMVDKVVNSSTGFVGEQDGVVLFVNNLGGMSQLEMGAVVRDTLEQLDKRNIRPARVLSSSYMTSLNAPGFSLSLLNVSKIHASVSDVDILALIDDPTDAVAWVGTRAHWPSSREQEEHKELLPTREPKDDQGARFWADRDISPDLVKRGILSACKAVLRVEAELTDYDTVVGDGDCGVTFASGAQAVMEAFVTDELIVGSMSPSELVSRIGDTLEDNMGGTIGALAAIFFTAWSSALSAPNPAFSSSLFSALDTLSHHTPAKPGDRTIIDALHPFCTTLGHQGGLGEAVQAARKGAEKTRGMKARLGRAVYVGAETGDRELPPDPGAWGVLAVLEGFRDGVSG
ncbi:dihydroxyacetone kinase [Moniliophthora roreri MCA 2997]|uniref:Dihydroxyacetone kinase n=2 Tax=Moniliophthora roreri TaxID=221103 RepID=V2X2A2_MONRO|nr:dihydroxyacetone kinase [Moniliophthora roreri MCA 2997]KAI3599195.1 dihydroxyacetone kinase [Moniliophthora roreri]